MAKRQAGATRNDPIRRGGELIEELNTTLNHEFAARSDYREAIETAQSFLEGVLAGLDDDERREAREAGES